MKITHVWVLMDVSAVFSVWLLVWVWTHRYDVEYIILLCLGLKKIIEVNAALWYWISALLKKIIALTLAERFLFFFTQYRTVRSQFYHDKDIDCSIVLDLLQWWLGKFNIITQYKGEMSSKTWSALIRVFKLHLFFRYDIN